MSRNDFLQDNKWHLYLQYCNEFYFVVPKGLVKKEELPDHVGLIYFNPDTKALRTVKKALYRQIEEPVGVYKYIIFSRLEEDRIPFYNDRAEYCKDYLEDKVVKSAIGQRLGTKLAKDLEEAEKKLKSLQNVEKELQAWKKMCIRDRDVVYDATNLKASYRVEFLDTLRLLNCKKVCVFVDTPFEVCVKRNEERERTVPKEAMDRMKRFLEPPTFAEGWDEIRVVKNWDEKENSDGGDR